MEGDFSFWAAALLKAALVLFGIFPGGIDCAVESQLGFA